MEENFHKVIGGVSAQLGLESGGQGPGMGSPPSMTFSFAPADTILPSSLGLRFLTDEEHRASVPSLIPNSREDQGWGRLLGSLSSLG